MGAKLDIVTPLRSDPAIRASHNPDKALEAAREASRLLGEAAELLYAADIYSPICRTREAAIKLRTARTAVDSAILEYNRSCSRERLTTNE